MLITTYKPKLRKAKYIPSLILNNNLQPQQDDLTFVGTKIACFDNLWLTRPAKNYTDLLLSFFLSGCGQPNLQLSQFVFVGN